MNTMTNLKELTENKLDPQKITKIMMTQGLSFETAKNYVSSKAFRQSPILSNDVGFWPSVGDFYIQECGKKYLLHTLTEESSIQQGTFASFREARDFTLPFLLQNNTLSVCKVENKNITSVTLAKYRYRNTLISIRNLENILQISNKEIEMNTNVRKTQIGDILISSSALGFTTKKVISATSVEPLGRHSTYDDALAQALALVQDKAVWADCKEGIILVSEATKLARPKNAPDVTKFKEMWDNRQMPGDDSRRNKPLLKDIRLQMINAYMDKGWSFAEASKEVDRVLDYWDRVYNRIPYIVDTGYVFDDMQNGMKNIDLGGYESNSTVGVGGLVGVESKASPKKVIVSEVFVVDSPDVVPDENPSIETASLPEISNLPLVLVVIPTLKEDLFGEDIENLEKANTTDDSEFLFGDVACENAIVLSASKNIPPNAKIVSKKVRFSLNSDKSKMSVLLSQAFNFTKMVKK